MPHSSPQDNLTTPNVADELPNHHLDAVVGGGLTTFYSVRNQSDQDAGDRFNGNYFVHGVTHAYTNSES